ncbi:hypothetical protein H2201_007853 [Coniosporium apollinis]|uniref:Uncharacterized protein n=1 Tax=Coniosporium apollinis TaxID=61459 RepID=A0ABQ9NJU2_9PEZI|nr:hypothetical protein H2201_007853 [Coniosporium apollinis]
MVSFKILLPLALAATGAMAKSATRDALISIFGPVETWDPIRAVDVDPTATFEGKSVNYSLIITYQPPKEDPEKWAQTSELRLAAQGELTCFNSSNWLWQNQLQSGKDGFCGELNHNGGLQGGRTHHQHRTHYKASDGSFQRFTDQEGRVATVFYSVTVRDGFVWSYNNCYNSLFEIIVRCKGRDPNSSGGFISQFNHGSMDARIDPWE